MSNHDLCCVRGTTYPITLAVDTPDGTPYHLAADEVLRFGIKASVSDARFCYLAELTEADRTDDCYTVTLRPEDTRHLPLGVYLYDAGILRGQDFFPVIPRSRLYLVAGITPPEVNHG